MHAGDPEDNLPQASAFGCLHAVLPVQQFQKAKLYKMSEEEEEMILKVSPSFMISRTIIKSGSWGPFVPTLRRLYDLFGR